MTQSRRSARARQGERKGGAVTQLAPGGERAAVQLGQRRGDEQTEPVALAAGAVAAVKALEQVRQLGGGDAATEVAHADDHLPRMGGDADLDALGFAAVL